MIDFIPRVINCVFGLVLIVVGAATLGGYGITVSPAALYLGLGSALLTLARIGR